jgi:hypothetical protein
MYQDARIAALEMMDAKKHRQEIAALQAARAEDLAALRDQVPSTHMTLLDFLLLSCAFFLCLLLLCIADIAV